MSHGRCNFCVMVQHSTDEGRQPIELDQLEPLGEKVWRGGGRKLLRLVEQVKQGKLQNVNPLNALNSPQSVQSTSPSAEAADGGT
jgi:hypothetical protein